MIRTFVVVLIALLLGCAPSLVRTNNVWKYESSSYELAALPDGRIMPDGWALTNYEKKGEGRLEQAPGETAHLRYVRNDDDGIFELSPVRLSDGKRLRVYAERYISQMRTHQEVVTVRNWVGIPQSTAMVDVDHPVQEVASAPFTGDRLEGYEAIVEQRRPGEQQPYRLLYLAFVRPVNGFDAVQVAYENSPSAFKNGVDDVRALVRRIRFGDRAFTGTLQSLDRGGAPADLPAAGAPVEL